MDDSIKTYLDNNLPVKGYKVTIYTEDSKIIMRYGSSTGKIYTKIPIDYSFNNIKQQFIIYCRDHNIKILAYIENKNNYQFIIDNI